MCDLKQRGSLASSVLERSLFWWRSVSRRNWWGQLRLLQYFGWGTMRRKIKTWAWTLRGRDIIEELFNNFGETGDIEYGAVRGSNPSFWLGSQCHHLNVWNRKVVVVSGITVTFVATLAIKLIAVQVEAENGDWRREWSFHLSLHPRLPPPTPQSNLTFLQVLILERYLLGINSVLS